MEENVARKNRSSIGERDLTAVAGDVIRDGRALFAKALPDGLPDPLGSGVAVLQLIFDRFVEILGHRDGNVDSCHTGVLWVWGYNSMGHLPPWCCGVVSHQLGGEMIKYHYDKGGDVV